MPIFSNLLLSLEKAEYLDLKFEKSRLLISNNRVGVETATDALQQFQFHLGCKMHANHFQRLEYCARKALKRKKCTLLVEFSSSKDSMD
jgi:hypothetical protein